MATLRLKHNPSRMQEDELLRSFVVRQRDLAAILETVRENTGASNQHLLILGPRGMGKTTLVNRATAEIRRDPGLDQLWYPILFDEESYSVTSSGELWFQALSHLADQTRDRELERARRSLQHLTDRTRLRDASLARLLEFADARQKRLLLVLENIDMIFDDQLTDDDAWDFRHTLQNEPRIAVLATSPTRLDSFHDSDRPLFELFREHTLDRLDLDECRTVWRLVTGSELPRHQCRPIQIFTGGNTRLLTILASFAKERSFRELMDDLVGLIDENTPYFKHNVEALPRESRKIFVALAELWSPATARQVADQTRGDIRAVSAQLGRLQHQGIIEVARHVDKTMMYQVSERMYNLYHLLRRRGSGRVHAVVEFIVDYYDQDGMQRLLTAMAEEARGTAGVWREDDIRAYCERLRRRSDEQQRQQQDLNDAPHAALRAIETAVTLNPNSAEDRVRCQHHLQQAAKLAPTDLGTHAQSMVIHLAFQNVTGARWAATHYIEHQALRLEALGEVSAVVLRAMLTPLYPDVVAWARELVGASSTAQQGRLLLVQALARSNVWEEELWSGLAGVLKDEPFTRMHLREVVEALSLAAARGHGVMASTALAAALHIACLEPLAVALARINGHATNPPQEIDEIAADIVRDIDRLRQALADTHPEPRPTTPGPEHRIHRRATRKSRDTRPN